MQCSCQSGIRYNQCCRPYHQGKTAPTAETLMRSRYSAYVVNDIAYIHRSWSKATRPNKKALQQGQTPDWIGLDIVRTELGGEQDTTGTVEFIAHFQTTDGKQSMHETSRFTRENGRWVYIDGQVVSDIEEMGS